MASFSQRIVGSAMLQVPTYEEVEHDKGATGQAMAVVVLSSLAAGVGVWYGSPRGLIGGIIGALLGWVIWALLAYVIGTKILPEPQTEANVSQLLRTLGFASAPGILRFLGIIPVLGSVFLLVISIWMLVAFIIAIRQALDYRSTWRAVAVAIIGWIVYMVLYLALFRPIATTPI
jgi:hypothetical protein